MRKLLLIITIFTIVSCGKNQTKVNDVINTSVGIYYTDNLNRDLLDTNIINSYRYSNIKHYYLNKNMQKIEIYKPNLDYPKLVNIHKVISTNKYILSLEPYIDELNIGTDTITSILSLNGLTTDTVSFEINSTYNIIETTKIWYNRVLKYSGNGVKEFTIVK